MSVWRRKAIEAFPGLRRELNDRHEIDTVYGLWIEYLLPLWVDAHTGGSDDKLDRIYRYAEWCFRQRSEDLVNSAGVCFYEHVLDHGGRERVLPRLSDATIRDVWGLWELRLSGAEMEALRTLLHEQKRPVPPSGSGIAPEGSQGATAHVSTGAHTRGGRHSARRGTRPRRDQRP